MAHSPPTDDHLPVPVAQSSPYLRIQPATDALDPDTIESHARRLHRLGRPEQNPGFLANLRQSETPPTIEWVLTGTQEELTYYVRSDQPEILEEVESTLRGLFPDTYAIKRVQKTRAAILSGVTPTDTHSSPVAIEYERHTSHRRDWQTRLSPTSAFYEGEQTRLPLSGVIETIANSPYPIVFQTLMRPKPDWSTALETRQLALEDGTDTLGGTLTNAIFGPPDDDAIHLTATDEQRLAELDERDPKHSFEVNARALVGPETPAETQGLTPNTVATDLESAFT